MHHNQIRLLILGALLCQIINVSAQSPEHWKLGDVIPHGRTTGEILDVRFSPRAEELAIRLMGAVATNQDWWMAYVKSNGNGALPYHTNLGLSHKEYDEYLAESEKTRHLQKVADAYLVFRRKGDDLSIGIGDTNSPVNLWRLNLSTRHLMTQMGDAGEAIWKSSDDTTLPIGSYEGYQWHQEKGDATMGSIQMISLWIYRQKPTGKMLLRIQDAELRKNRSIRHLDLMFRYDFKPMKER